MLLTKYLTAIAVKEHKQFYVHAMTGHLPKNLQDTDTIMTDDDFTRKYHGFAHFRVQFYKEDNHFKDFDTVKYYYVINQKLSEQGLVKLRADLNEVWNQKGSKNIYVLVLNELYAYEIPANQFLPNTNAKYNSVEYVTSCMNTDRNWLHVYDLRKHLPTVYFDGIELNKKLDDYLTKSEAFIEPTAYAKYKSMPNSRTVKVINSKTNKVTNFKSLKQCFDLMRLQDVMNYKKFQRITKTGINTITVRNIQFCFITESSESIHNCED